jgi:mono/diheme cytochrome c family protein
MAVMKRLIIFLGVVTSPIILGLLFTYDIVKLEWISFMEVQPSYRPMEDPLPLPEQSVPVQGAAIIRELGAPVNPVIADQASIARGEDLYNTHCALCHGPNLDGNGTFSGFFQSKPSNLVDGNSVDASDGYIFVVISNGLAGKMPAMVQNLPTTQSRWDVVNYVRSIQRTPK